MPGYRELSEALSGDAAERTRHAQRFEQQGLNHEAVAEYEAALMELGPGNPMPGFVCGRLAALYRRIARYDDEVTLLERYRESQVTDEARTRYDARLSKARAIADTKRRSDCGALASVRALKERRSGALARSRAILEARAALAD
jgi:hypothetical protein